MIATSMTWAQFFRETWNAPIWSWKTAYGLIMLIWLALIILPSGSSRK